LSEANTPTYFGYEKEAYHTQVDSSLLTNIRLYRKGLSEINIPAYLGNGELEGYHAREGFWLTHKY